MNKKQLLLLSIFFITLSVNSQVRYRLFDYYQGYIVKLDGTKEFGYIQHLDESDRYVKVIFRKTRKAKKQKFKPKTLKAYHVADVTYHSVKFKEVIMKAHKFLILESEGCINKYSMRQYDNGEWQTTMVFSKDGKAVSASMFLLKFAKKMSEFVKDDENLADKVRNKEKGYRLLGIENIINEYNDNCNN
jgi:hypothetical protein